MEAPTVIERFERRFDGDVRRAREGSPRNESLAVEALRWLGRQVADGSVDEALFVVNHPSSDGYNHPRRLRQWRDSDSDIAVGFTAAPGHQAGGYGPDVDDVRGLYSFTPRDNSYDCCPEEAYRTWGGFDWMVATVGGMWDSLLAEGARWWITVGSDSHVDRDRARPTPGALPASGEPLDFRPGVYSRTHVGVDAPGYAAVLRGLRLGRGWVDHGHLLRGVDVRLRTADHRSEAGLGGTLCPVPGEEVELVVTLSTQDRPNAGGLVPALNRVDVIRGRVAGRSEGVDLFTAPDTRVVEQIDTSGRNGSFTVVRRLGPIEEPAYVRLRGTDGNRTRIGLFGLGIDPAGPAEDDPSVDPWLDLWFYTNPIWIRPRAS